MKTTATLLLEFGDDAARRSLDSVLAPDNEGLPRGLMLSMKGADRRLEVKVESDSPSTAISTTLALLRDITLFQEVWLLSHGKDGRDHRS
jgi:hypothetical protein